MYSFAHFCCITIAINQRKSIRVLKLWMLLEKHVTKIKHRIRSKQYTNYVYAVEYLQTWQIDNICVNKISRKYHQFMNCHPRQYQSLQKRR